MEKFKFRFYLALDQESLKDPEKFQHDMESIYVNGIEPTEYHERALLDAANGNVVQTVVLVECKERWKGAAKRFFRKAKFEDTTQKVDNLPVYG